MRIGHPHFFRSHYYKLLFIVIIMVTDDGLIKQYFVYGFDVIVVFVILIVSAHDGSSIDVALIGSKRIASHRSDSFTSFYNCI